MRYQYTTFEKLFIESGVMIRPKIEGVQIDKAEIIEAQDFSYLLIKNAIIYPFAPGIFVENRWIFDDINYAPKDWNVQHWMNLDSYGFDNESKTLGINKKIDPKEYRVQKGNSFYIDTVVFSNFGHFIHDVAPSAQLFDWIYRGVPDLKPVLKNKFAYKNQQDIFEKLFLEPNSSIAVEVPTIFENLYVPRRQQNFYSGYLHSEFENVLNFNIEGMRYATKKLSNSLGVSKNTIKKIYLYRKAMNQSTTSFQNRSFENTGELNQRLLDNGFLAIDPSELSIIELHSLLFNAEIIVSIHGAGLANMIFANIGTTVIEIRPSTGVWRSLEFCAKSLGYVFHSSIAMANKEGGQVINVDQVMDIVKNAI